MSVSGKVALVTGGASGIGRAATLLLARRGAKVVVADLDEPGAQRAAKEIEAAGGAAIAVRNEIGDAADVQRMVDRSVAEYGRIDILLHSAGICPRKPFLEMSDEDWHHVIRVNLDGAFYVARRVGTVMAAQKSGTMIMLTSDRGYYGAMNYAHYAATKGALIAFTRSLALNLGPYGVTVNGINPGMTDTPLGRGAQTEESWKEKQSIDALGKASLPEEIAETVLFLSGPAAGFMTGQIVGTRIRTTT